MWWQVGKDARYVQNVESRMNSDILPALGDREIDEILPSDIRAMAQAIEKRGAGDIARRAHQTVDQIFRWGLSSIVPGAAEPCRAFKPKDILQKIERENFKRVDLKEFPELLRKIHYYDGSPVTRLGLKLMALTFLRTTELIAGEWAEIDWKECRWDIPKERMKGGKRPHIVPLSKQAIEVLQELQNYKRGDGKYMFPGERGNKFISNNTILHALWKMGYKDSMTGHGFRGVASTWLHEHGL